jgi:hypothetical protein
MKKDKELIDLVMSKLHPKIYYILMYDKRLRMPIMYLKNIVMDDWDHFYIVDGDDRIPTSNIIDTNITKDIMKFTNIKVLVAFN